MNGLDILNSLMREWHKELCSKWPEAEMLPARSHLDNTIILVARPSNMKKEICCALFCGSWTRNCADVTECKMFDPPIHYTKLRRPFLEIFRASMDDSIVGILGVREGDIHAVRQFKSIGGALAALEKVISYGKAS
jgi:hypothetical protein